MAGRRQKLGWALCLDFPPPRYALPVLRLSPNPLNLSHNAEPRIGLAVPIIACPDYMKLISNRARYSKVPLEPPYFTESLRAYIAQHDPACAPYTAADASNPFFGKKILVMSGGNDPLVPFKYSEEFVEGLNVGPNGVKKVIIEPGVEHECTPAMVKEMAEFVWEHSMQAASVNSAH
jgi:hypothetical protein